VGVLGEQREAHDVQGVMEQVERGQLGGTEQLEGCQRRRWRGSPHVLHRFLAVARLPTGAGAWNTSK
jgi:hypothetical protein